MKSIENFYDNAIKTYETMIKITQASISRDVANLFIYGCDGIEFELSAECREPEAYNPNDYKAKMGRFELFCEVRVVHSTYEEGRYDRDTPPECQLTVDSIEVSELYVYDAVKDDLIELTDEDNKRLTEWAENKFYRI